jgi:hypothetical protein
MTDLPIVTSEILDDIEKVLDYMWDDELADYRCCDPVEQEEHIYRVLLRINSWVGGDVIGE